MKSIEMPPIPFKLFGLQRSGTNLARWLMLHNFHVVSLEMGNEWKHGVISVDHQNWIYNGEHVRLIICVKNPYSWLVSCYNYFVTNYTADPTVDRNFDRAWSFEEFVQSPSYHFRNPIERWNRMIRHWIEFPVCGQFTEVILHELMLDVQNQRDVLTRIEQNQRLFRRHKAVRGASQRVDIGMRLREPFESDIYLNTRYLIYYTEHLLDFVNRFVDTGLFEHFGYKKISFHSR